MRTFEIVSSKGRRKLPVAWLYYDPYGHCATIRIAETAETGRVPALFDPFIEDGSRKMDSSDTLKWVQERVPSPSQPGVNDLLDSLGLDEYDPYPLLLAAEGRCDQDDYFLREETSEAYEYAVVSLQTELGEKISQARKKAGLTQVELAYRSGVQQAMVSKLEHGKVNPTLETLQCLARAMGTQLEVNFRS